MTSVMGQGDAAAKAAAHPAVASAHSPGSESPGNQVLTGEPPQGTAVSEQHVKVCNNHTCLTQVLTVLPVYSIVLNSKHFNAATLATWL